MRGRAFTVITRRLVLRDGIAMPDGTRKRRYSRNFAKRLWYAQHHAKRFARRFGRLCLDTHRRS